MTPERWQQISQLYQAALDQEAADRSKFISSACADDLELRREVESLIKAHEQAGSFIAEPALRSAAKLLAKDQKSSLIGTTLAHYRIESILGAGGMGEVYLALDVRLNRKVALKLLPATFLNYANQLGRFEQEARAASALNHPNIITIHEIGEVDGRHFIVTEFLDGETLREHMTKRRMTVGEVLDAAAQITSALQAAHEAGIVHRDIKPENIMLGSRGQVKVLDFGLAKTASATATRTKELETKRDLTTPGMILGTVPYMSPEQLRGETVDARTDIFSLGVVIYEMLSGRSAFGRNTNAETIGAIQHEQPPALSSTDSNVPEALEDVVRKCLAKDVTQRYQTVRQVADDLNAARNGEVATIKRPTVRTFTTNIVRRHKRSAVLIAAAVIVSVTLLGYYSYFAKGGEAIDSIAVLPFVNVGNDQNMEYFSDGISDSLIDRLSQLPNLKTVISLNSVLPYKGKQVDAQAVGRELSVRAVLMGRLTLLGDEVWISTELIDAKDSKRLWGGKYKLKLAEVLPLQGEIAQEISEGLRLKLTGEEKQRLAKSSTDNPEAYQLYMLGRFYRSNRAGNQKSIDCLERAIKKDPNFAPAYAQLAYIYAAASASDLFPGKEARERVESAVQRALELDGTLGDAHAALALMADDWSVKTREFQRALELAPNSADVHAFYARVLWARRRIDEAILHMRRAVELDPLSPALNTDLGKILYSGGQRDQAMAQYRKALELNPNYAGAHHHLANLYLAEGRYQEAIAEAEKRSVNSPNEGSGKPFLGYTYAVAGKRAEAEKILHELKELSKQRDVGPEAFALIYTGLGDKDRALELLKKEYEENKRLPIFINILPEWDSLRRDPRFEELIRQKWIAP